MKVIKSEQQAINILKSGGVRINEQEKTQTWTFGMAITDAMLAAGKFLDNLFMGTKLAQVKVWTTVWKKKTA